ncbi:MAG TPA: hypothetical protein VGB55_13175 [Tepidisphaeraceae bacterium]|jgi:hypothetical protein
MPDQPSKPDASPNNSPEKPVIYTRDLIDEALARQAELRPFPSPPKEMPTTPTLPKQPRPARERKKEQERLRYQNRPRGR